MVKLLYFDDFAGNGPRGQAERAYSSRPPANLQARKAMLAFRQIRRGIAEGAERLAPYYEKRAPPKPKDFDLRFARIAYAMYLLDTLDRVLKFSGQDRSALADFESARAAVAELLDEGYFTKSAEQIIAGYRKLTDPLERCAGRYGLEVLMPEPAVERWKLRLAEMIDSANGYCV